MFNGIVIENNKIVQIFFCGDIILCDLNSDYL